MSLEGDMAVVAELERGDQIMAAAMVTRPDVAVIDIDLPRVDGLTSAEPLHEQVPSYWDFGADRAGPQKVLALDVWVDGDGIVHRLNVTMSTSTNSISYSPRAMVVIGNFVAQTMTDVVSLAFSQLGEPETITTPTHASTSAPPGCGGSDSGIIPQYGVLPAVPLIVKP